jgi:hypothetical protein
MNKMQKAAAAVIAMGSCSAALAGGLPLPQVVARPVLNALPLAAAALPRVAGTAASVVALPALPGLTTLPSTPLPGLAGTEASLPGLPSRTASSIGGADVRLPSLPPLPPSPQQLVPMVQYNEELVFNALHHSADDVIFLGQLSVSNVHGFTSGGINVRSTTELVDVETLDVIDLIHHVVLIMENLLGNIGQPPPR